MSDYYPDIQTQVAGLPLFASARSNDPSTSQAAAARAPVRGHCRLVLQALRAGPAGQTEIGRRCGLLPHQVNKRLADLARVGLVEVTGRRVEGGTEREWKESATFKEGQDGRRMD